MARTSHQGASLTARELASWHPGLFSADGDLLPELGTLVARSRDLTRNHGVASGAIQTLVDNVVGTGLRLVALPDYHALQKTKEWADSWSREVESLWRSWAESIACDAARSLTFAGLTIQIFRESLTHGEALVIPRWRDQGTAFHTCLQVVESDRLSNPGGAPDTHDRRGGIEIDDYGAPLAYWIKKTHPGEVLAGSKTEWERIEARTAFGRRLVLHIHEKERTGQSRGKPLFSSVLPLFKMLDHYEHAELQAAVINAMIAAFIETPKNLPYLPCSHNRFLSCGLMIRIYTRDGNDA